MDEPDRQLIKRIRRELRRVADPTSAPQMQAYMKSSMPYLGVRVPQVRRLVRAAERERPPDDVAALVATATALWRAAEFREERYAAAALTDTRRARQLRDLNLLPLYYEMIVTGRWWDHVDETSHRVGELLTAYPADMAPVIQKWSIDADLWLRRSSIICQLQAKDRTDLQLLTATIEANLHDGEFFIRKAIGWALRDYARTDPDWVRGFVERHADAISPLSHRRGTAAVAR